jgi:putative salt-induced outer membrane protein YdiY
MSLVRTVGPLALAAIALFAAPRAASAQAAADTAKVSPVKGSIDLGLVASTGNTDLTTFSLGQKLEYLKGKWDVTQGARMVNGQTDGVETANEYAVFVQPAYQVSARWKGYVLGSWDRNPFIGIVSRWQEGLGLSFAAVRGSKQTLDLDGGLSLFQQEFTTGENTSFTAARGQVKYRYSFTEKAYFQDIFVYLPNLEDGNDYRINNEAAVVAPVAGRLALKASYLLQYQNAPQPGFERTDNLYTTGLQVTF